MEDLASSVLALAATTAVFSLVTARQGRRRWFGLKGLVSARLNETEHDPTFQIPADIQRRFRRIIFWRTMLKNPFLWEKAAHEVHDDMMEHLSRTSSKPRPPRRPDVLDWAEIIRDREGFYRDYIRTQKPFILKNTPYDRELWTTERIRSLWGDKPMVVHDTADEGRSHEMTLNQMIEYNREGKGCAYMSFNRTFFEANRDLITRSLCAEELHDLLKKRRKRNGELRVDPQLFISTESTHPTRALAQTFLHSANNINMFFNIEGRKRWVLVDPEYSLCVYPSTNIRGAGAFASLIKSASGAAAEMSRFPLYESCPRYEVDLEEGDVLFVPCWWWHSVEALTPATLSIALRVGLTALGSLFPGDMNDPNTLFTTLQIAYPQFKREVYDVVRTNIKSRRQRYDGTKLREIDVRQELEKDYEWSFTHRSAEMVRMWRDVTRSTAPRDASTAS